MTTKRDIVTAAFAEIGLADYVFDLQPEQLEHAKTSLDRMAATWNGQGIAIAYPLGASDLDDVLPVPDWAHDALVMGLAVRLAPGFGKMVSPDTKAAAMAALNIVRGRCITRIAMVPDTMAIPAGAGHKTTDGSRLYLDLPDATLDNPSGPIGLD